jgi:hypothetical protein
MTRSFKAAATLGFVLLATLTGCPPTATRPSFPDIRFTDEPKLRLDVASIQIIDDYHPTFQAPNVDHLFPVPPQRAAENWAHDRLEATGTARVARVRIVDASVKETELPRTQGITGAFTTDQAQRYDATIEVDVEIVNDHGLPERTVKATGQRSQSVAEGITPNERDTVWYNLTKQLLGDLDKELEKQMRANFTFYIQ